MWHLNRKVHFELVLSLKHVAVKVIYWTNLVVTNGSFVMYERLIIGAFNILNSWAM